MPRIERDPTGDLPPDDSVIEAALPASMTAEQRAAAIQSARNVWQTQHDAAVVAWNQQKEDDAAIARQAAEDEEAERQRLEEARQAALKEAEDADRLAQEAKRPKFNIDSAAEASVLTELQAPTSAREDLRKGKWVAWHLFTPEMCREDLNAYQHDQEFKLAKADDGGLIMQPSRRLTRTPVIPDRQLTYEQWSSAIPTFLRTIKEVGWPDELLQQWNSFLFQLQHHPARFEDSRAVVIFAADYRADWHRAHADGKSVFNISRINAVRMMDALATSKRMSLDAAIQVSTL
ncbi:hypothetical protein AURDEDRAFT_166328 [Auricularia subglabra TFB-10046 SS5]|uniref:Uncharacterized protein n=1 Tax=Auricularia subglabra (strain TFB-10046 / SS5) TaxID=717982 RepID=J0WZ17_AURST|nr:hypothetical protein AURDEDRAFT_166328 [Auricularia subglabra TFB-10046 SS5]